MCPFSSPMATLRLLIQGGSTRWIRSVERCSDEYVPLIAIGGGKGNSGGRFCGLDDRHRVPFPLPIFPDPNLLTC